MIKVAVGDVSILKFPSRSVIVPLVVPFTMILAPIIGSPIELETLPDMLIVFCA